MPRDMDGVSNFQNCITSHESRYRNDCRIRNQMKLDPTRRVNSLLNGQEPRIRSKFVQTSLFLNLLILRTGKLISLRKGNHKVHHATLLNEFDLRG